MILERHRPSPNADTGHIIRAFSSERVKSQKAIEGIHPEQLFAVNIGFADNLLTASKRSAKKEPLIPGLVEPGMNRRQKRRSQVIGLLHAYIAQETGDKAVAEFRTEVGDETADALLTRLNSFLPDVVAQRDAVTSPQTIRPDAKLLKLFEKDGNEQLPYLRNGESANAGEDRDIIQNHVSGLTDAFHAIQMGEFAGRAWMEEQHGERSDYLLREAAKCVAPVLNEQLVRVHAPAEAIEPYDVKMAEKSVQRRGAWLPQEQLDLFSEITGVEPDKKSKRLRVALAGLTLGIASMFTTDGAAGAVAKPVENEHFHLLESADGRLLFLFWAATYSVLGHSVWKNILAQNKLRRETGMSVNAGSAAGGTLSEASGAGSGAGDKVAGMSQAAFELVKDTIWNIGIGAALLAGTISLRDAAIFSAFANLGGTGYEYTGAALINTMLKRRRKRYNADNPFSENAEACEISATIFDAAHTANLQNSITP